MSEQYNVYGKKSYEYALGRISGTPHRILTAEMLGRLREADTPTAEKLLADFGYPQKADGQSIYDVIEQEKNIVAAFVREISPDEELVNLLFFEEDALNLKFLLKAEKTDTPVNTDTLTEGGFSKELLRVCVQTGDYSMLGETLEEALTGIEAEDDPCKISCKVDNAVFAYALSKAKAKHCRALEALFTVYGAGKNRLTALRLKRLHKDAAKYDFAFLPVAFTADESKDEAQILADTDAKLSNVLTDLSYDDGIGAIAQYYFPQKGGSGRAAADVRRESVAGANGGHDMSNAKIAAVGRHESILLFSAAGIKTVPVTSDEQALDAVRQLVREKTDVIFLTENFAEALEEPLKPYRATAYPVILPVPEKSGPTGYSMAKINANMEKALGTNLFNKE